MVPSFLHFVKLLMIQFINNCCPSEIDKLKKHFFEIGYAIIQKVPESILGILVAVSAVVGVLGSVAYPLLKK